MPLPHVPPGLDDVLLELGQYLSVQTMPLFVHLQLLQPFEKLWSNAYGPQRRATEEREEEDEFELLRLTHGPISQRGSSQETTIGIAKQEYPPGFGAGQMSKKHGPFCKAGI